MSLSFSVAVDPFKISNLLIFSIKEDGFTFEALRRLKISFENCDELKLTEYNY